jgi:hypothetical protein
MVMGFQDTGETLEWDGLFTIHPRSIMDAADAKAAAKAMAKAFDRWDDLGRSEDIVRVPKAWRWFQLPQDPPYTVAVRSLVRESDWWDRTWLAAIIDQLGRGEQLVRWDEPRQLRLRVTKTGEEVVGESNSQTWADVRRGTLQFLGHVLGT